MGQRHGAWPERTGFADVLADITPNMPAEAAIPSHMVSMTQAMRSGQLDVLFLFDPNVLSSIADANARVRGLERLKQLVSYDLFLNETSRRYADLVLPATAWLESVVNL